VIEAKDFIGQAMERDYTFWTGVPCSFLTPFINYVIDNQDLQYLTATSEGEAVGIAAGAYLAGKKTVVMCQNSGLGNTVNPLTSLNFPFRIPTLLIVTHRGAPGLNDEPQHELMGQITEDLLTTMHIQWCQFPDEPRKIAEVLDQANEYMESAGLPFALIMEKGVVAPCTLKSGTPISHIRNTDSDGRFVQHPNLRMTRLDAIRIIRDVLDGDEAIVATTGHIGRELFALGHRCSQFYVVGSMGCASGVGLGIHQGAKNRAVVVLDGDGAALMKMGTFGTIGYCGPKRLLHIILDNEAHESTGGQATASAITDFTTVAAGCGYSQVWRVENPEELARTVRRARLSEGPNLVHVKVALGSDSTLGRPTLSPFEIKKQFMKWISQ